MANKNMLQDILDFVFHLVTNIKPKDIKIFILYNLFNKCLGENVNF